MKKPYFLSQIKKIWDGDEIKLKSLSGNVGRKKPEINFLEKETLNLLRGVTFQENGPKFETQN